MAWTATGTLKGPQGDPGQTGQTGSTGPTGPTGPPGVVSASAPIVYNSGTQALSLTMGSGSGLSADTLRGLTDGNFTRRYSIDPGSGVGRKYVRLFTLDGVDTNSSTNATFLLAGAGANGNADKTLLLIQAGQRGLAVSVKAWSFNAAASTFPPELYYRQGATTYEFEVWAYVADYNRAHDLTPLARTQATVRLDSVSTTMPTGLSAVTATDLTNGSPQMLTGKLVTDVSTTYPYGLSLHTISGGTSWVINEATVTDGVVTTLRHAHGSATQRLDASALGRSWVRGCTTGAPATWTAWVEQAPPLAHQEWTFSQSAANAAGTALGTFTRVVTVGDATLVTHPGSGQLQLSNPSGQDVVWALRFTATLPVVATGRSFLDVLDSVGGVVARDSIGAGEDILSLAVPNVRVPAGGSQLMTLRVFQTTGATRTVTGRIHVSRT